MGFWDVIVGRHPPQPPRINCDLDISTLSLGGLALGAPPEAILNLFGPPINSRLVKKEGYWLYPSSGLAVGTKDQKINCFIIATRDPLSYDFKGYLKYFESFAGVVIFGNGIKQTASAIEADFVLKQLGEPEVRDEDKEELLLEYQREGWVGDFEFAKTGLLKCIQIGRY